MNRKRVEMLVGQSELEEDEADKIIDELNNNIFQKEWTKALESENPEELEAFERKWGLNHYGIDALREEMENGDDENPVVHQKLLVSENGIEDVHTNKESAKNNTNHNANHGHNREKQ